MDTKLATEQFKALAQLLQQSNDGVDLIFDVAAEAMESRHFDSYPELPEALKKTVSRCLDASVDMNCFACLDTLKLTQGRNAEEAMANLTAEEIEAARLEQVEKANGKDDRIARINDSYEYITKQYPAAFAALKVLQEQGWLSDPGADLAKEHEAEPQAIAA